MADEVWCAVAVGSCGDKQWLVCWGESEGTGQIASLPTRIQEAAFVLNDEEHFCWKKMILMTDFYNTCFARKQEKVNKDEVFKSF
jgi:hypothetical protein